MIHWSLNTFIYEMLKCRRKSENDFSLLESPRNISKFSKLQLKTTLKSHDYKWTVKLETWNLKYEANGFDIKINSNMSNEVWIDEKFFVRVLFGCSGWLKIGGETKSNKTSLIKLRRKMSWSNDFYQEK